MTPTPQHRRRRPHRFTPSFGALILVASAGVVCLTTFALSRVQERQLRKTLLEGLCHLLREPVLRLFALDAHGTDGHHGCFGTRDTTSEEGPGCKQDEQRSSGSRLSAVVQRQKSPPRKQA